MLLKISLLLARLLRLPNLLVVALTQYLVGYHILYPVFATHGIPQTLSDWKFLELLVVTVLITGSGYVINDLQDERLDDINRPGTNPVVALGHREVYWYYGAMILVGFLVSQLLAFRLGEKHLLWIYPLAVSILAGYSVYLKKKPLLGNVLVALYCAGVPGIVLLAEREGLAELAEVSPAAATNCLSICFLFMAFALLATLLRELVKDLEDYKGDLAVGRKTIPVLWGVSTGRIVAIGLGVTVALAILAPILLGWPMFLQPALLTAIGVLVLGLLFITYQIKRANTPRDYHRISTELKFVLLAGLLLLVLF